MFVPEEMIRRIIFSLVLLLFSALKQEVKSQPVRIMFYNVENFFDIYNDSLTDDNDFLPSGTMRWNSKRYVKKLNSLYKTIVAAGSWEPPGVIALCEIENRHVLEDLIYGTYLSKYNYKIIHQDSPDRRGIDVCLIYRKKIAEVICYRYWLPDKIEKKDFHSRSVLYAKLLIDNDTIHIIVNHWPSKRGGVLSGEDTRLAIAFTIREKVDSILESTGYRSKIMILGDFNCTPDDRAILSLTRSSEPDRILINLSDSLFNKGSGTYRYKGTWEMIDQVIVSKALLSRDSGLFTKAGQLFIFNSPFLVKKDPDYPGVRPLATYKGYKYQGGFSDHLPFIIELKVR